MAENKKSFLIYCDLIHTLEKLPDDKAGQLFKHILRYTNDLNPVCDDMLLDIVFEPIKQQLKRDLEAWTEKSLNLSEKGQLGNLKRWHNDLYNQVINKELTFEDAIELSKNRQVSPPDATQSHPIPNIAVNVNVTDNVNDKDINKPKGFNFKNSLIDLGVQPDIVKDWLLVRKNKKATNTETAFNLIKTEIEKTKLNPNDCIKLAVEKSWAGFKSEWVKPETETKQESYTLANGNKMPFNFPL